MTEHGKERAIKIVTAYSHIIKNCTNPSVEDVVNGIACHIENRKSYRVSRLEHLTILETLATQGIHLV